MVQFPRGTIRIKEDPLESLKKGLQLYHNPGKFGIVWKFFVSVKMLLFIFQCVFLIQAIKRVKGLAEVVTTFPLGILAILKFFLMRSYKKRIQTIYETIDYKFWDINIASKELVEYIEFRFTLLKHLVLNVLVIGCSFLVIYTFFPYIHLPEGTVRYPMGLWFPMDTSDSPAHEIIFFFCTCSLYLSLWGNLWYDLLFIYAGQHTSAQFLILGDLLKNLSTGVMENLSEIEKYHGKEFQQIVMDRLVICCKHHVVLINFSQVIKKFAYFGLLGQVAFFIIILVAAIVTIESLDVVSEYIKSMLVIGLVLGIFQELVICAVQSSDLNHSSTNLADEAYLSDWHLYQAPIKRTLTLLIMNAQKGIKMTAGDMIDVDNEIIVFVMQKTVSMITLLHTMQEKAALRGHPHHF